MPATKLIAIALLLCGTLVRAQDVPDFDSLPVITGSQSLDFKADTSTLIWIEPEQAGLFEIRLEKPGLIQLYTFETEDGRFNGQSQPELHQREASMYRPVSMGPLLLGADFPYIMLVTAKVDNTVVVEQLARHTPQPLNDAATLPDNQTRVFPLAQTQKMAVGDLAGQVRNVQVLVEPRASRDIKFGRQWVPESGLSPRTLMEGEELRIESAVEAGPAPLVLVRTEPAGSDLDEREPNDPREGGEAQRLDSAGPFRARALASGDVDRYFFELDQAFVGQLKLTPAQAFLQYELKLWQHNEGEDSRTLLARERLRGETILESLQLPAGRHFLQLERADKEPANVDYTISLSPGESVAGRVEREPNDSAPAATTLPEGGALRGRLSGNGDRDFIRFEIPVEGHHWRLTAIRGVEQLILTAPPTGEVINLRTDTDRLTADALALHQGRYIAELRGEGDYAFKLMDLGPAPEGYETEPNNHAAQAERLYLGDQVAGMFHAGNDNDYYRFELVEETPVELSLRAPEDGTLKMRLEGLDGLDFGEARIGPEQSPYRYRARLPVGRYQVRLMPMDAAMRGTYELGLSRLAALNNAEPDHLPERLSAMPLNGRWRSQVGGLDDWDVLHLPLPTGSGQMAVGCYEPYNHRWRLWTYGDNSRLIEGYRTPQVLDYSPELGGAVKLVMDGGHLPSEYRCHALLPPASNIRLPEQSLADVRANGARPGHRFTVPLAEPDEQRIEFDMAPGDFGATRCRQGENPEPVSGREAYVHGSNYADNRLGSWSIFYATERPSMEVIYRRMDAAEGDLHCELLGPDQFATLADAQPLAIFDALTRRAPEEQAEGPKIGHYAPQLLEAQRPDWLSTAQPSDDLPVTIEMASIEPLAAYSKRGQRVSTEVQVRNSSDESLNLTLTAEALADGWSVSPRHHEATLTGGQSIALTLALTVPPMASPSTRPALAVTARAGERERSTLTDLVLDVTAPERQPFTYWDAPEALRGGLNVLRYQMGARLSLLDDKPADDGDRSRIAPLHDGLVPHIDVRPLYNDQALTFELAESTPVAGAMFHLRSTRTRGSWPAGYELELAGENGSWQRIASGELSASNRPQYVVFDMPVTATRARLNFTGCRADPDCKRLYAQEAQLIATPGWRPSEAVNIAAPQHGGHIVHANRPFGGGWHYEWLQPDNRFSPFREINPRWGDTVHAVLGFHYNRAAAIKRIEWINKPEEWPRFPQARVEYSLAGPGGPWRELGTLTTPPEGETLAALELDTPVWARYLRFSLARDAEQRYYGPQQLKVFEDRDSLSLLGLWEADSPRAAYEYLVGETEPPAPEPKGGPDADNSVALPLGERVNSSVLLERNEDWWSIAVPGSEPQQFNLRFFGHGRQEFLWYLESASGERLALREDNRDKPPGVREFQAVLEPGQYRLRFYEPPRSIIISWDTSGSVGAYIPRTLAAVRTWATSLAPGREALQLLPFGMERLYLPGWAEAPADVLPHLRELPTPGSSSAEMAMMVASEALKSRDGARGIVIITDAETPEEPAMWPPALDAQPRVVALSIDSDERHNASIMMDWANINRGYFHRVVGQMGLADGLDLAAALFRTPKAYALEAELSEIEEIRGNATLTIRSADEGEAPLAGAVELILDASGSMLQPLSDGQRRITVARQALVELARERLPDGANFAFRAFGWEANACRSELVVPLAPLDRDEAATAMRRVPAVNLSKTPIADSLLAARDDLAEAGEPRVIVLVTDGEETCGGDVDAALAALREAQFDVRVNVVGFAVDDPQLVELFESWAENGGGAYFDASQGDALASAIDRAMQPGFAVIREYRDGREERVATLGLGEAIEVPAGQLRIEPLAGAVGKPVRVLLQDQQSQQLRYLGASGLQVPPPSP